MGSMDLFGSKRKPGFNKGDKSTGGRFKKAPILKSNVPTSNPRKKIEPKDVSDLIYGPQTPQIQELILRFNKITKEDNDSMYHTKRGTDAIPKVVEKNDAINKVRDSLWLKENQEPWASRINYYNALKIRFNKNTKTIWVDGAYNNALLALIMKDLIGKDFPQKDYDTLMEVWKQGMTDLNSKSEAILDEDPRLNILRTWVCEVCQKELTKSAKEAHEAGWDTPPYFTGYIKCDGCPITKTAWYRSIADL